MTEEYRQIEEFDNYYVSNYGNIKNKHSDIILSRHDCRGVLRVNLCKDGKKLLRILQQIYSNSLLMFFQVICNSKYTRKQRMNN